VARRDGDRRGEFWALEQLIAVELQRGRHMAARALCDDLAGLGEKLREGSEAPFARALHALLRYATTADDGDARAAFDQALMDLRIVDAKQRLSSVLMQAALVELDREAAARASALAEEAAAVAEILGRPSDLARARAIALRCALATGDAAAVDRHAAALRRSGHEALSAHARREVDAVLSAVGSPKPKTGETPNVVRGR
jgi:hypothetical protein